MKANKEAASKKCVRISFLGLLVIALVSTTLFLSRDVNAEPSSPVVDATVRMDDSITKKVRLLGIKSCWNNTYMQSKVSSSNTTEVSQLMTNDGNTKKIVFTPSWNGLGNTYKETCNEVVTMLGNNRSPRLSLPDHLLSMGYQSTTADASRKCYRFSYVYANKRGILQSGDNDEKSARFQSNALCFAVDSNGKLKKNKKITRTGSNTMLDDSGPWDTPGKESEPCKISQIFQLRVTTARQMNKVHPYFNGCMYGNNTKAKNLGSIGVDIANTNLDTPEAVMSALQQQLNNPPEKKVSNGIGTKYDLWKDFAVESATSLSAELKRGSQSDAVRYFSGVSDAKRKDFKLTEDDVSRLYSLYIENAIAFNYITVASDNECKANESDFKKNDLIVKRNGKWCKVTGAEKVSTPYNLVKKDRMSLKGNGTLVDVIKALRKDGTDVTDGVGDSKDDDEGGDGDENMTQCHKAGKKIGWITCAALEGVADVIDGVYEYIEKEFLYIKPVFFSTDSKGETQSAVYEGWKIFRDIANVIFALLFVIVIFSQLTGFGLDNYGVKRILPRLIMVAILVNISFILCQGAVDISNILGAGLRNMFEAMIPSSMQGNEFTVTGFIEGILHDLLSIGVIAGAGAATVFAVKNWSTWMMPVLLTLFVSVISVVFFFLLLGARQAGVMIAVVVAPVAIVCYALPNTKKLFDRWYKIFSSLLLVYPIAGLLMGGGKFASTLLVNINNGTNDDTGFAFNLVAMLISLIPFFFIPKMVQSSMNAIGNIGTGIQRMGARLRGSAHGAIRSSDTFKSAHKRQMANSYGRRGNRMLQKREKRLAAGKKDFSAAKRRRMNRYLGMHTAQVMEDLNSKYNSADYLDSGHRVFGEDKEPSDAFRRMDASMREGAILNESKRATAAYESDGETFQTDNNTAKEYEKVLRQMADSKDIDSSEGVKLQGKMMSLQSQLGSSDSGIKAMQQATARVYSTTATKDNQGLVRAASMLRKSQGGVLKNKDRDFFEMNNAVAMNKGVSGTFKTVKVKNPSNKNKEEDFLVNTEYAAKKADSMDPSKFANMSESGQLNMIAGIEELRRSAEAKAKDNYNGDWNTLQEPERNQLIAEAMSSDDRQRITTFADNAEAMLLNSSITKDNKAINAANLVRQFDAQFGQTAYEANRHGATNLQRDKMTRRAQKLGINDSSDTFKVDHSS